MTGKEIAESNLSPGEKAEALFRAGYNCTQSVTGVFAKDLGIDFDTLVSLSQPLGGGMCRMREVCGTVSGMLLVLGMAMGDASGSKEKKDAVYAQGQSLAARFRQANGSIECRELLGLVPLGTAEQALKNHTPDLHVTDSPVSQERTAEYYKKRPCPKLCAFAAELMSRWLAENPTLITRKTK